MIEMREKKDIEPICPHCDKPLLEIWFREIPSFFGRRYIYVCPNCRKCLSISHRKGYWIT